MIRQDLHQHLLDSTQQHLLLLMNDSVEKKKTIADLLTDSVEKKKTIADLLIYSAEKKKTIADLLTDSDEKKKSIDMLSATNQILNGDLKKLKADFDVLKETVVGTSKDQILSNAKLGGIFKDMCQEDEFQEILLKEFDGCLNKAKAIAQKYEFNIFMSSIAVEDEEQQLIDAISKEMEVVKNNFIQNKMIVKYTQKVVHVIDDFVKMKVDSPSACCKQTFEQLKSHIKTFHYFEHMNQVRMFHGKIEDILNNPKKSFLCDKGYCYLRLEWKSYSHGLHFSPNSVIEMSVGLKPLIIYFTREQNVVCLVNATGDTSYGKHSYDAPVIPDPANRYVHDPFNGYNQLQQQIIPDPVTQANQYYNGNFNTAYNHIQQFNMTQPVLPSKHEYRWEQSYEGLKKLGFIVNDIFILRVK